MLLCKGYRQITDYLGAAPPPARMAITPCRRYVPWLASQLGPSTRKKARVLVCRLSAPPLHSTSTSLFSVEV